MLMKEAHDILKKMIPSIEEVIVEYEEEGDASRDYIENCYDENINIRGSFAIRLFGKYEYISIAIPNLIDEKLYREWLERSIRSNIFNKQLEYKEYRVREYATSEGFNIYTGDTFITYASPDKCLYHCVVNRDDSLRHVHQRKGKNGIERDPMPACHISNYLHMPSDLYKHPGNESIHHLEILFPTPASAYYGSKVYYDPNYTQHVLLRIGDTWLWTHAAKVLQEMPSEFRDELLIMTLIK